MFAQQLMLLRAVFHIKPFATPALTVPSSDRCIRAGAIAVVSSKISSERTWRRMYATCVKVWRGKRV
eukprot:1750009-Pleurochrysis_carterae.AAC.1